MSRSEGRGAATARASRQAALRCGRMDWSPDVPRPLIGPGTKASGNGEAKLGPAVAGAGRTLPPPARRRFGKAIAGIVCAGIAGTIVVAGPPSQAAVRLCEAPISTGPVHAMTERDSRAGALAAWRSATRAAHGERYVSWRLASGKVLKCVPDSPDGFACIARASPCTIEQAPDRRHLRKNRIGV